MELCDYATQKDGAASSAAFMGFTKTEYIAGGRPHAFLLMTIVPVLSVPEHLGMMMNATVTGNHLRQAEDNIVLSVLSLPAVATVLATLILV